MKETFLTKEGYQELNNKLHQLKTVRRREVAEAIHTAKEQGDLSENAEYVNAKEEQRRIETQIADLQTTLKQAQVVSRAGTDEISVGNTVRLKCNGKVQEYMIVGSNEADPLQNKISNESPIGEALMGKKKGDSITIPTPVGDMDCKIIEIQ